MLVSLAMGFLVPIPVPAPCPPTHPSQDRQQGNQERSQNRFRRRGLLKTMWRERGKIRNLMYQESTLRQQDSPNCCWGLGYIGLGCLRRHRVISLLASIPLRASMGQSRRRAKLFVFQVLAISLYLPSQSQSRALWGMPEEKL